MEGVCRWPLSPVPRARWRNPGKVCDCLLNRNPLTAGLPSVSPHPTLNCVHAKSFSRVRLFATPWTVARLAPLSMGFSRQEYWSGLPCPPPGDLLKPGIQLTSPAAPALQVDSLPLSHQGSPSFHHKVNLTPTALSFNYLDHCLLVARFRGHPSSI